MLSKCYISDCQQPPVVNFYGSDYCKMDFLRIAKQLKSQSGHPNSKEVKHYVKLQIRQFIETNRKNIITTTQLSEAVGISFVSAKRTLDYFAHSKRAIGIGQGAWFIP